MVVPEPAPETHIARAHRRLYSFLGRVDPAGAMICHDHHRLHACMVKVKFLLLIMANRDLMQTSPWLVCGTYLFWCMMGSCRALRCVGFHWFPCACVTPLSGAANVNE